MLSTSAHHVVLNTTHSRHYGVSLTYMVLRLCIWHKMEWRLRQSCFWRRSWSEWLSAKAFAARFPESGKVTLAQILQTLRFPSSAAFLRRVEDFRLRVAVYTVLHGYTYASLLCVCLWTQLHGGTFPAHTVPSSRSTSLYEACTHCGCITVTIPTKR